ncbi:MAG: Hpt domain-containing protein [Proteobacteria bacterium]|nr:Hpt domain-containing protein [Pseudomonadota bacterium]
MSFEQAISTSLAAAVGDDRALVAELETAFMESASRHVETMRNAADDQDWREAALRLKGLAASFGATTLMQHASKAADARRGDAEAMRDIERGLMLITL